MSIRDRRSRSRGAHRRGRPPLGITLIEVLLVVAIIGILAFLGSRPLLCHLSQAKMASKMSDLSHARDLIEAFEVENGYFPPTLRDAFTSAAPPVHLIYCVDDEDGNRGQGNEFCTFFDEQNPSDNNPPQSAPGAGYLLLTERNLCPCKNVDFAWLACCGMQPAVIGLDGDPVLPGHPGHGPDGPGRGGGPGRRGG